MLRYQRPRESSLKLPARNSYFDRPYESHRPMLMPLKRTWPFLYVSARALNGTQPSEYFADLRLLTRQLSRCFLNCLRRVANSSQTACCVADPMLTPSHFEKPLVSKARQPDLRFVGVPLEAAVLGLVAEVPDRVHVASHRKHHFRVLVLDSQFQCPGGFHFVYYAVGL